MPILHSGARQCTTRTELRLVLAQMPFDEADTELMAKPPATREEAAQFPVRNEGQDTVVNLAFTKFIFIVTRRDDDAARTRVRTAGAVIARGFFNDFDADGSRDVQPRETIQFLTASEVVGDDGLAAAPYVVQVTASYRPRLSEVEWDLRRRLADHADILVLDGAYRAPRYTSPEMHAFAYKQAMPRMSGRAASNVVILPIRKTDEWWMKPPLERHAYFYPHIDAESGCPVKGHARAAEAGVSTIFRRVYHNPDGYRRDGEYDFITYFECEDRHLETFDEVCAALRDTRQNPEWRFVLEGPEWRGRRVLKW